MRSRLTSVIPDPGSRAAANGQSAPATPAPIARQRRRSMLWLGVALAAAGALVVAWLFTATGHQVPVLAVARNVPVGAVITASDLSVATVSGSGITTIPARQESQVTGRTAAVGLQAGSLLVPSDLTSAAVPGPGQQLVPVPLKASELPASGLAPGDQVLVIATPGAGGQAGSGQSAAPALAGDVPATVYQVSAADQSGDVTVDLIIAAQNGPPVARQASTGQIAIIVTPRNG
jgi:hypothetical protein